MNDRRIAKAANDIDTLADYMKGLVAEIREETDTAVAYAKIYYARQDLGRVVASLGSGVPSRSRTNVLPLNLVKSR